MVAEVVSVALLFLEDLEEALLIVEATDLKGDLALHLEGMGGMEACTSMVASSSLTLEAGQSRRWRRWHIGGKNQTTVCIAWMVQHLGQFDVASDNRMVGQQINCNLLGQLMHWTGSRGPAAGVGGGDDGVEDFFA